MNKKISTLAIAALFSIAAVSANAGDTVTYNGFNYLLNVQNKTFTGNEAQIQSTPWWGNRDLALALTNLYNPTVAETGFVYVAFAPDDSDHTKVFARTKLFGDWTTLMDGSAINSWANNYVFATSVTPVPEADSSAMLLMGAGVMGFIARRRKQAAV
jgi:hypothetical protein